MVLPQHTLTHILYTAHTHAPNQKYQKEEKTEKKKSKGDNEEEKSYVSIIGDAKGVQAAKMALLQRLGRTVKIKVDITARTKSLQKIFGTNLAAALRRVEGQCGGSRSVKITVKENPRDCQVSVSGYFNAAQKAKSVIEAAKRGHVVVEIPTLSSEHVQFLQDTHAALIAQIQRRNSVTLKLEVDGSHIHITGGKTNVRSAEDGVHNCLQFSFSKNYARFAVSEIFATSLRANKFAKVPEVQCANPTHAHSIATTTHAKPPLERACCVLRCFQTCSHAAAATTR